MTEEIEDDWKFTKESTINFLYNAGVMSYEEAMEALKKLNGD